MDFKQRVGALDPVTGAGQQQNPGAGTLWCTGELGDPGDQAVVDSGDRSADRSGYQRPVRGGFRFGKPALCLANRHETLFGRATFQQLNCGVRAGSGCAAQLKQKPGECQRPIAQIRRRIRGPAQHFQHIRGFQRRADPASHRLVAVADMDLQFQPDLCGDRFQPRRQGGCRRRRADLSGWSHGNIDDHPISPCGGLLGQDTGGKLAITVKIQRPFNADHYVIGRAEVQPAAPDNATALRLDHPAHCSQIQRHRGHHLHDICSPRGGCDSPAGRFRDDVSGCGSNRHHDRCGPVAGQPADAMLVQNQILTPAQAFACRLHGPCQSDGFLNIQPVAGTGGHKGGKVQVREPAGQRIADDGAELSLHKAFTVNLGPNERRSCGRFRVRQPPLCAGTGLQGLPRCIRQRGRIGRQPTAAGHHIQRCDNPFAAAVNSHPRQRPEPFGLTNVAIRVHVDNRVAVGVDAGWHQP